MTDAGHALGARDAVHAVPGPRACVGRAEDATRERAAAGPVGEGVGACRAGVGGEGPQGAPRPPRHGDRPGAVHPRREDGGLGRARAGTPRGGPEGPELKKACSDWHLKSLCMAEVAPRAHDGRHA